MLCEPMMALPVRELKVFICEFILLQIRDSPAQIEFFYPLIHNLLIYNLLIHTLLIYKEVIYKEVIYKEVVYKEVADKEIIDNEG